MYHQGVNDFSAHDRPGHGAAPAPAKCRNRAAADPQRTKFGRWHGQVADGLAGGNAVETVFIPEPGRGTLCVSSQVGCALNCTFCSTGAQGFNRNLATGEIIGQVWLAARALGHERNGTRRITNVVMMGMGEPLLNFDAVMPAIAPDARRPGIWPCAKRVTCRRPAWCPASTGCGKRGRGPGRIAACSGGATA